MAETRHKKKILYVITKASWGGAGRYVFDLATSMSSKNYEVAVALGTRGTLKDLLEDSGIKTHSIAAFKRDMSLISDLNSFWELYNLLRQEKPDIVHLNSSKMGGLGSLAGRIARVPWIIFTVHGWYFNEDRSWMVRFFTRILSYITAILCHRLIMISKKDHKQALSFPFVKTKIIYIPNGIKQPHLLSKEVARRILLQKTNLSASDNFKVLVGAIGELHANKGYIFAIKAIEKLRSRGLDVALIIIGEGDMRLSLEKYVSDRQLRDHVFLVGNSFENISESEGSTLVKAFDIFLLPSLKEGLPYALLEAGAAGLPVIATSVGGVPDIIVDMKSGMLVRKRDEKELAEAVSYLASNEEKRREFGECLSKTVSSDYSLFEMIKKTFRVYEV